MTLDESALDDKAVGLVQFEALLFTELDLEKLGLSLECGFAAIWRRLFASVEVGRQNT